MTYIPVEELLLGKDEHIGKRVTVHTIDTIYNEMDYVSLSHRTMLLGRHDIGNDTVRLVRIPTYQVTKVWFHDE
jgi:hypothetical protein